MIVRQTITELATYLESARETLDWLNPELIVIEIGRYQVRGRGGNYYEVVIGRTAENKPFVACGCYASLHGRSCYHALAAYTEIMKGVKSGSATAC